MNKWKLTGGYVQVEGSAPRGSGNLSASLLVKQILQYAPGALAPAVVGLFTAAIFTRVLNSDEYGRFSLIIVVTGLLSALVSQWLQQSINRFLPERQTPETVYGIKVAIAASLIFVALLITTVTVLVAIATRSSLDLGWRQLLWPSAVLVLSTALFTPLSVVHQAELNAARYTGFNLMTLALRTLMSLAFVFLLSPTAVSLAWATALAPLILVPVLWMDTRIPGPSQVLAALSGLGFEVRRMVIYGFPMTGWFLASALLNAGDRFVIQLFRGSAEVGLYSANYVLVASAAGLVASPILLAAHPILMRAWGQGDRATAGKWLGTIVEWFAIAGIVMVGVLTLFAKDVAYLLLGSAFREGYQVMPLVLAGSIMWQLGMYGHKPLEFAGATRLMFWLITGTATLNTLLNIIFVPIFGYIACAYTTLISYASYFILAMWLGRRVLPWQIRWKSILFTLLICSLGFISAGLIRQVLTDSYGHLAGLVMQFAIVLATVAILFMHLAQREFRELLSQFKSGSTNSVD